MIGTLARMQRLQRNLCWERSWFPRLCIRSRASWSSTESLAAFHWTVGHRLSLRPGARVRLRQTILWHTTMVLSSQIEDLITQGLATLWIGVHAVHSLVITTTFWSKAGSGSSKTLPRRARILSSQRVESLRGIPNSRNGLSTVLVIAHPLPQRMSS